MSDTFETKRDMSTSIDDAFIKACLVARLIVTLRGICVSQNTRAVQYAYML